jgi:hypothetical protein
MEALEDAMKLPLCGIFLVSLSAMCLVAFSVITVKYYLNPLYGRGNYVNNWLSTSVPRLLAQRIFFLAVASKIPPKLMGL